MKLHRIDTGFFKLDGGAMFGVVPKTIWNKTHPCDENNLCDWAMRCLLIEDGKRLILVDNGIGNKLGQGARVGNVIIAKKTATNLSQQKKEHGKYRARPHRVVPDRMLGPPKPLQIANNSAWRINE